MTARAQTLNPNAQGPTDMRARFTFSDITMTAVIYDIPSVRDFYAMLPLDPTISDFAHNEKIASPATQAYRGGQRRLRQRAAL